jgi:branched-chain amino acid transport system permease protein
MTHVVQVIVDGLSIGSTYALVGVGFTLVFGVLGILNGAHADFYMLGAFVSLWIGTNAGAGALLGVLAAIPAGAVAGLILYVIALRRLSSEELTSVFIATLGVSFFLQYFVARIVGPEVHSSPPLFQSTFHDIGGVFISDAQILLIGSTVIVTAALMLWIGKTTIGRDMRAVAENSFLARAVGVRAGVVMAVTIAIASAIAALGGVLVTNVSLTVTPFLSNEVALKMFVVAMVAGAGSVGGAAVAGIGLGIAESVTVAYAGSQWQDVAPLLILVLVLMFRPQGLFGKEARVG